MTDTAGTMPTVEPGERPREAPAAAAATAAAERRPAIVAVDDEPAVLAAVARDLRRGFGERFRVLRTGSGPEAL
ncbi:MAG: thioredoxin reductase, partial [Solirubrobacteraceae bacterium]|nr:thioredoxin reductase [Solirubrobacteraceae bacterium]